MDIRLIMFTDKGERREFPLHKPRVLVGRTVDADLRIPLSVVSRRQCEISRDGDAAVLRDLGSSNGTTLNGVRVKESQLSAGDKIGVGPVTFVVVVDGKPADIKPPIVNGRGDDDRLLPAIIDEEEAGAFDTEPTVFQNDAEAARADRASASLDSKSASAPQPDDAPPTATPRPTNGSSSHNGASGRDTRLDGAPPVPGRGDSEPTDEDNADPISALEALARQIGSDAASKSNSDSV